MTALELDALAARIAAGAGPDREIDAEFARVVCGWSDIDYETHEFWQGVPPGAAYRDDVPAYTDALAGPGALFAEARRLWPDACVSLESLPPKYHSTGRIIISAAVAGRAINEPGTHPDLSRALMLAITAAKRAEIAGGGE